MLQKAATLFQASLENTAISIDVVPDSLEIFADRQLVDQVLINLVKNAGDALAGREDGEVRLVGRLDLGRTIISVIDNGPGIHEDDIGPNGTIRRRRKEFGNMTLSRYPIRYSRHHLLTQFASIGPVSLPLACSAPL